MPDQPHTPPWSTVTSPDLHGVSLPAKQVLDSAPSVYVEEDCVIVDGPGGLAITMTVEVARAMAADLTMAAQVGAARRGETMAN